MRIANTISERIEQVVPNAKAGQITTYETNPKVTPYKTNNTKLLYNEKAKNNRPDKEKV